MQPMDATREAATELDWQPLMGSPEPPTRGQNAKWSEDTTAVPIPTSNPGSGSPEPTERERLIEAILASARDPETTALVEKHYEREDDERSMIGGDE